MLLIREGKRSGLTEFSLEIWDLFELLTPSSAPELQTFVDREQRQGERLTGKLSAYSLVGSSSSAHNLCRYIKSKIFFTTALWGINERRNSEAVLAVRADLGVVAVRAQMYGFLCTL